MENKTIEKIVEIGKVDAKAINVSCKSPKVLYMRNGQGCEGSCEGVGSDYGGGCDRGGSCDCE